MTEHHDDDAVMVHLAVDDAHTAQLAGATFARTLAGAHSVDFALALAEQTDLIERAIVDAGFSVQQGEIAAEYFEVAARDEWRRIADTGGGILGRA